MPTRRPTPEPLPVRRGLTPATDPGGLAAAVSLPAQTILVALGLSGAVTAKWLLVGQAVLSLAAILWARARAWPPAKVWLESLQARSDAVAAERTVARRRR